MSSSLRFALRSLARTPGFTLLVVLCLGLGIGVNVAFLGVLDVLLLRPPAGVDDPAALYRVEPKFERLEGQRVVVGSGLSRGDVDRLAARRETFARVTAFAPASEISLGTGPEARQVDGMIVDGAYFGVVGVRPVLGRLLGPADAERGAPITAVLSERLWRAAFGADSGVVGRRVRVSGEDVTIVGVAGDGFTGIEANAVELWLSLEGAKVTGWMGDLLSSPDARWLYALARLAPGATPEGATRVTTAVLRVAPPPPHLDGPEAPRTGALSAVTSRFGGEARQGVPVPTWLLGATAAVLLVACANVANLLLARGEARRREVATRIAIGASRGALVRQLLAESAVLALAGGAVGLVLAQLGTRLFALLPGMPPLARLVDARVAAAALAVVAVTTLLCGLVPAFRGTRLDAASALRAGARSTGGRSRLRGALMVGQLAAALALLATGGVFVRSLRALHAVDTGFDLRHAITMTVNLGRAGVPEAERTAFAERALARVRAVPGVAAAARSYGAPLSRTLTVEKLTVDGVELPSPIPGGMQFVIAAGDRYFEAMGQRIVRGRAFTADEQRAGSTGAAAPVVVSEAFARAAWGGADPIGRCVRRDEQTCAPVVGVADDVTYMSLRDTSVLVVYQPLSAVGAAPLLQLVVRARGDDVAATARAVRAALQGMDPRMPYVNGFALVDNPGVRMQLAPFRLAAAAFSLFGGLALVVAAVGLYAVVAYSVARRTGEIGVRVALGAQAANIRRLVLGEGARHALLGCVAGIALGAGATRLLRAKLYGVAPFDLPTFVAVTMVLAAVALLASWLPARRAAAIPPTQALRTE